MKGVCSGCHSLPSIGKWRAFTYILLPQAAQAGFAALRRSCTYMFLHVCAFFFAALPPLLWLGNSWLHCAAFVPAVHVGLGATVSPSVRPFEGPAHYLRLPLGSFGSAPASRTSHRRLAGRSANRAQRSACAHLAVRPHTQCDLDALGGMKLALLSSFIPLSCLTHNLCQDFFPKTALGTPVRRSGQHQ